MSGMKTTYQKLNPYHWSLLIIAAIVAGGATYASTTWNEAVYQPPRHTSAAHELPDQNRAAGLQAQPGGTQLNRGANSESLQAPAVAGHDQNNVPPLPSSSDEAQSDPPSCRGMDPGAAVCLMQ
jgi:hypothetical protein